MNHKNTIQSKPSRKRQICKWICIVLIALFVAIVTAFLVYSFTPSPPMEEALQALASTANVTVTEKAGTLLFQPKTNISTIGVIYYPGGHVDYRSYSPFALDLANLGFTVYLASVPMNFAIFNTRMAEGAFQLGLNVSKWVVAGHSLGGCSCWLVCI
jgi:triacylglycerol esterase/lipase EstA (alpha/beta hydrolase family)